MDAHLTMAKSHQRTPPESAIEVCCNDDKSAQIRTNACSQNVTTFTITFTQQEITSMGFTRPWALYALSVCTNDPVMALSFIFDNTEGMDALIAANSATAGSIDYPTTTDELTDDLSSLLPALPEVVLSPPTPEPACNASHAASWLCAQCTFKNNGDGNGCEMCLAPRDPHVAAADIPREEVPSVPVTTSTSNPCPEGKVQKEEASWLCGACTFKNPGGAVCCVCGAASGADFSAAAAAALAAEDKGFEPEDERVARVGGLSLGEARDRIKQREAADKVTMADFYNIL